MMSAMVVIIRLAYTPRFLEYNAKKLVLGHYINLFSGSRPLRGIS